MMEEQIRNYKEKLEEILKNTEEYKDYKIDYMFVNNNSALTYASVDDNMIKIVSNLEDGRSVFDYVSDWDFNFDEYFFENLEEDWGIGFISDEVHSALWNYINDYYPYDDIYSKDGVQGYLQYCADKGINKEFFKEKGYNDVPDVMQYFNGLGLQETMNYKGWIIEADDINPDNLKENLVNIYNTKEDYDKKIPNETISLNTIKLKENIANYIETNYISKMKKNENSEKGYFTFVLGYDLLNDEIRNSPKQECDLTYEFCSQVADKFIKSDYYKDYSNSSYEMLEKYIKDNKIAILKDYEKFLGIDNRYFDGNKILLLTGKRNNQPVAVVKWKRGDRDEFVIAINYEINGKNISWGRGVYYYDKKDCYEDFSKVLNGEYLDYDKKREERDR